MLTKPVVPMFDFLSVKLYIFVFRAAATESSFKARLVQDEYFSRFTLKVLNIYLQQEFDSNESYWPQSQGHVLFHEIEQQKMKYGWSSGT